jgi:hypothetical protein
MEEHKDDCSWLELRADFYNYLPILAPPNIATTPCILDKTLTPTPTATIPRIPQKPQKPLLSYHRNTNHYLNHLNHLTGGSEGREERGHIGSIFPICRQRLNTGI